MKWLIVVVRVRVPLAVARAVGLALALGAASALVGPELAAVLLARGQFGSF